MATSQNLTKLNTEIRLSTIKDLPFIISSWTQTIKHIYPNQYALDFSETYHTYLSNLINKSTTIVSHLAEDNNEIISYLVYTSFQGRQVVHFAYTKVGARQLGELSELLRYSNPMQLPIIFTHPAKNETIMKHFCSKTIFDPTILPLIL